MGSNWMLSPVFHSGMSSLQEKEILSGCFKKNKILKIKIQKSIAGTLDRSPVEHQDGSYGGQRETNLGAGTPREPGGASVRPTPAAGSLISVAREP